MIGFTHFPEWGECLLGFVNIWLQVRVLHSHPAPKRLVDLHATLADLLSQAVIAIVLTVERLESSPKVLYGNHQIYHSLPSLGYFLASVDINYASLHVPIFP